MSKKKLVAVTVIVVIIIIVSASIFMQAQNKKSQTILGLTTEEKIEDFEFLCRILDETYPFWDEVKSVGISKNSIYSTYHDNIKKSKTDIAYLKELGYFLKEFKGFGHLLALDGYLYRLYFETLTAGDNMFSLQEKAGIAPLIDVLSNTISANTYSLLDQSHSGFRSTIGLKEEYQSGGSTESESEDKDLFTDILTTEKVAYLKIPSFQLTNYQDDQVALVDFWNEILDYPHLIIDLRGNSGGSDLYWQKLLVEPNAKDALSSKRYFLFNENKTTKAYINANISSSTLIQNSTDSLLLKHADSFSHFTESITQFAPSQTPFSGEIWVLVDKDVYSASENFVIFCKNTGFATIVGTSTGGDGGIANPMLVALPNSGLIVRFSIFYGLNSDGTGNEAYGTTPDLMLTENEDALEKCLSLID